MDPKNIVNKISSQPADWEKLSKRVSSGKGNLEEAEYILDLILVTITKNKPLPLFLSKFIQLALKNFKKSNDLNKAFWLIKNGRPKASSPDYSSGPSYVLDIAKEMMSGTNKTSAIAYIASKDNSYKVSTLTKDFNIYRNQAFKTCVAEIYLAGKMLSDKQLYTLKRHTDLNINI